MDETGLETVEEVVSPEAEVERLLQLAASYLAAKIVSAWKPESSEDLEMRLSGARLQQRLVKFVLENYDPRTFKKEKETRRELKRRLGEFWQGYYLLVRKPLEAVGYNRELAPDTGLDFVLSLQNGVRGLTATCLMAQNSGWQIEFPTAEEDVRWGKDLILKKDNQKVALQVKCQSGAKFIVAKERFPGKGPAIKVIIPADDERFFRDYELGIPHSSKAETFDTWLNNQLIKGK